MHFPPLFVSFSFRSGNIHCTKLRSVLSSKKRGGLRVINPKKSYRDNHPPKDGKKSVNNFRESLKQPWRQHHSTSRRQWNGTRNDPTTSWATILASFFPPPLFLKLVPRARNKLLDLPLGSALLPLDVLRTYRSGTGGSSWVLAAIITETPWDRRWWAIIQWAATPMCQDDNGIAQVPEGTKELRKEGTKKELCGCALALSLVQVAACHD